MKVTCFLPCRKGSERVPHKNIREFAGFKFGLIEIKLKQLVNSELIDEIILSTNDDLIIDYASSLKDHKIKIFERNEELASSSTSTDSVVEHVSELIDDGHILWTHVTSPFLSSDMYNDIIKKYKECLQEGYDSLMTTSIIQGFLWSEDGPVNYDRSIEKWPRTQTIKPLYEVNSGVFINSAVNYRSMKDRIGNMPYLYPLDKIKGFDIDWQDDFILGEQMVNSGLAKI